ncbi:hypothetical protein [Brevundimonas faecalis]|uniref:Uncharacterized protein n=1 Tax=Brevundimonas faecalis TaxID=947378 RepID=A0ABV2RAV4_9CAUL
MNGEDRASRGADSVREEGAGGGAAKRDSKHGGTWGVVIAVLLLAVVGFCLLARADAERASSQPDANARIEESCRREYEVQGEDAVRECRIRLSIEYLQKAEASKMERARSGAGL